VARIEKPNTNLDEISHIGARLKLIRLSMGLKQSQVMQRADKHYSDFICGIEKVTKGSSLERVTLYEKALDLEPGTTAYNLVDPITKVGIGKPAAKVLTSEECAKEGATIRWGKGLQGERLDNHLKSSAFIINQAWQIAEMKYPSHNFPLEEYQSIVDVAQVSASEIVYRAIQLRQRDEDPKDTSVGEIVFNQYILSHMLSVIRRFERNNPENNIKYQSLVELAFDKGWNIANGLINEEKDIRYKQLTARIATEVIRQGQKQIPNLK
jgi:hypothetical protein